MQQAAEKPMFNPGDVTKVNGLRYVVLGQNEEGHFVAVPETAIITMHVDGGAVFVTEIVQEGQDIADELLDDLREAATTLRHYEKHHRAKGTVDSDAKAEVNATLASRFEATIAKAESL